MTQYKGANGSSKENAIIIQGVYTEWEGVDAEYNYMERKFGDFEIESQTFIEDGDRKYDNMNISYCLNQKKAELWFDITNFYGKE